MGQAADIRVTFLHSFYSRSIPSGENVAVEMEIQALREVGVDLDLFAVASDDIHWSAPRLMKTAWKVGTGRDPALGRELIAESPTHILHVHNMFPNFGTRALLSWEGPVVHTIHNYRTVCSNGLLMRAGEFCSLCQTRSPLMAIKFRCYRDSALASLPVAASTWKAPRRNPLLTRPDKLIVQSERARATLRGFDVPEDRLSLVPGFVSDPGPGNDSSQTLDRWLFVGRVSREKGLFQLAEIWPRDEPLDFVGDGPDRSSIAQIRPDWSSLGYRNHHWVSSNLRNYLGLIFPGVGIEGAYPLVVREAFAAGLPVVANSGTSAGDLVEVTGAGRVFDISDADSLRNAMNQIRVFRSQLGALARASFMERFTKEKWQRQILEVYREAKDSCG